LRKTPRLTPLARGFDRQATDAERPFFYFPFMHAQALADQQRCCELCRESTVKYAELTPKRGGFTPAFRCGHLSRLTPSREPGARLQARPQMLGIPDTNKSAAAV
jgi:hypothetical protein